MKYKLILLATTVSIAASANARDQNLQVEVQITEASPQLSASMDQGQYLIRQREYGLAVNVFRKILRIDPDNARAYSAMAIAYDGLGRKDLARKNFELALGYAPMEERHYRNLARHLAASGEPALAAKVMRDFNLAQTSIPVTAEVQVSHLEEQISHLSAVIPAATKSETEISSGRSPVSLKEEEPSLPNRENKTHVAIDQPAISPPRMAIRQVRPDDFGLVDDDEGIKNNSTAGGKFFSTPTTAETVVAKTTKADLYDVMAQIYEGLGEQHLAEENRKEAASERSGKSETDQFVDSSGQQDFDSRLQKINEDPTKTRQAAFQASPAKAGQPLAGAFLTRQSLGEVLLTTNASLSRSTKIQLSDASYSRENSGPDKIPDARVRANQYYAAVRSILDSGPIRFADRSAITSEFVALKELDLAMAALEQKRLSRLPRIDRGPSDAMKQLGASLYRYAKAEEEQMAAPAILREQPRKFADFDICLNIYHRLHNRCVT